jgi:3-phosphoshikimate 1-carboxyvinyltransferase
VARLRERPVAGLVRALTAMGGFFEPATAISPRGEPLREPGRLPLRIYGRELAGGDVDLDPSASSQFVSALLLLGARLPSGLRVRLAGPPPSRPYIDMTADVLRTFGAHCTADADGHAFAVDGGSLRPAEIEVEGDWSAAAFPFAAVAVAGGEVEVEGLSLASRQGDTAVASLLAAAGCSVRATSRGVAVAGPARGRLEADLRDTPDLFPALAVVVARGGGRLGGLEGLAAKESDRPAVMAAHLAGLGFSVRLTGGALVSEGRRATIAAAGAPLDPADDHRIAMALAVAGTLVEGVQVAKPACVAKSWPSFWQDWQNLVVGAG